MRSFLTGLGLWVKAKIYFWSADENHLCGGGIMRVCAFLLSWWTVDFLSHQTGFCISIEVRLLQLCWTNHIRLCIYGPKPAANKAKRHKHCKIPGVSTDMLTLDVTSADELSKSFFFLFKKSTLVSLRFFWKYIFIYVFLLCIKHRVFYFCPLPQRVSCRSRHKKLNFQENYHQELYWWLKKRGGEKSILFDFFLICSLMHLNLSEEPED